MSRSLARVGVLCFAVACSASHNDSSPRDTSVVVAPSQPLNISASVNTLLARADSLFLPDNSGAGVLFLKARDAALGVHDSVGLARALTGMGQVARLGGRFADSRRLGEQGLALKLRLGMRSELFKSYNTLGLLARDEERLSDAATLLDHATTAARAVGDSTGLAKAMVNAGLVFDGRGEFERARTALRAGADGARAMGDSVTLGRALTNLASLDIRLGDVLSGIASLDLSRRLAAASFDTLNVVNALAQIATAYDALGEPQRAFLALDSALTLARDHGYRIELADNTRIQADLYASAGDWRRALDGYARAAALDDALNRPEERGDDLRSEARVQYAQGRMNVAASRATEALRIHRSGAFKASELDDLCLLAEVAQASGHTSEAESYLRAAHDVAGVLRTSTARAQLSLVEARVADRADSSARVLRALDELRFSLAAAPASAVAEALALKARAYSRLGRPNASIAAGRRAVDAIERVRSNYASGALRTTYATNRMSVYVELILALLQLNRTEEALQVADAARGRALIDHLASARVNIDSASPSTRTMVEADRLLRRIDELMSRLGVMERRPQRERTSVALENEREMTSRLTDARTEYEGFLARTSRGGAIALGLLGGRQADTRALRQRLGAGEVLVEYLVTPERLLTFVATRAGVTQVSSAISADDLFARVRLARELLGARNGEKPATPVLEALHALLIGPATAAGLLKGARRLLIVPHASLTYLPFAALRDVKTQRYLVEDYSLMTLPSASALLLLRGEGAPTIATGGTHNAVVALAPFPEELPGSQSEVRSVARSASGATVYVGLEATEARTRQAMSSDAIVHTATHAVMNARNPLFSRLELSRGREGRGGAAGGEVGRDDGRLEVREVLEMRIHSPLIFLSGCETGLGASWSTPFDTGEDYTTLAQALLFAGGRNVVATLWRIDDTAAAVLAERFYARLADMPAPEALAESQRGLLRVARYREPYFWAAYQVSGGDAFDAKFAIGSSKPVQH